ncbi:MAG: class I SAM-dependent methyltransferase, partial [Candidatus Dormibacteraceae bacterium]
YHPVILDSIPTRAHHDNAGIDYLLGDFLTYPFEPSSFKSGDVIASVATLHHAGPNHETVALRSK